MIVLDLPYPPTLNHLYATVGRRRVLSAEGRAYHRAVYTAVLKQAPRTTFQQGQRLYLHMAAFPPDKRRRDIGNLEKIVSDSLTKAFVMGDDSQIDDLRIQRRAPVKGGAITVTIGEI